MSRYHGPSRHRGSHTATLFGRQGEEIERAFVSVFNGMILAVGQVGQPAVRRSRRRCLRLLAHASHADTAPVLLSHTAPVLLSHTAPILLSHTAPVLLSHTAPVLLSQLVLFEYEPPRGSKVRFNVVVQRIHKMDEMALMAGQCFMN